MRTLEYCICCVDRNPSIAYRIQHLAPITLDKPGSPPTMSKAGDTKKETVKGNDVRTSNIIAAKAVADAVRTSLGPKGMDKMIQDAKGNVIISNDGATIMQQMQVFHPTAKMLVELSKSQDIEAGDGRWGAASGPSAGVGAGVDRLGALH